MIEAADLDEALAWAAEGDGRLPAPVEVRPFQDEPEALGDRSDAGDARSNRSSGNESGRAVATLVRLFGDIDIAEEAVQEAFVVARSRWPVTACRPARRVDRHHRAQPGDRPLPP